MKKINTKKTLTVAYGQRSMTVGGGRYAVIVADDVSSMTDDEKYQNQFWSKSEMDFFKVEVIFSHFKATGAEGGVVGRSYEYLASEVSDWGTDDEIVKRAIRGWTDNEKNMSIVREGVTMAMCEEGEVVDVVEFTTTLGEISATPKNVVEFTGKMGGEEIFIQDQRMDAENANKTVTVTIEAGRASFHCWTQWIGDFKTHKDAVAWAEGFM